MTKHRYAAKPDANQLEIVGVLRAMGISVQFSHDDILCGWQDITYWYEVKDPAKLFCVDGTTIRKNQIKPSQFKLLREYRGHYAIVWSLHQILEDMGIAGDHKKPSGEAGLEVSISSRSAPITKHNLNDIVIND